MPAYVELGRALLNEDPDLRPSFEKAHERLGEILTTFRASLGGCPNLESPSKSNSDGSQASRDRYRQIQKKALERMRLVAADIRGASGEVLSISECIVCLDTFASTVFKGRWDGCSDVAVRDVLLVDGVWECVEKRSGLENLLCGRSVPEHPNLVCYASGYESCHWFYSKLSFR